MQFNGYIKSCYFTLKLGIGMSVFMLLASCVTPVERDDETASKTLKNISGDIVDMVNTTTTEVQQKRQTLNASAHKNLYLAQMYRQLARDVMQSQRPKGLDELALEEYELLLEEIAYPFEEKAIEIHTSNAQRTWQDIYDPWIAKSFAALAQLEPAQYNRQEKPIHAVQWLH